MSFFYISGCNKKALLDVTAGNSGLSGIAFAVVCEFPLRLV